MAEITQNLLAHLPDKNPTAMALRDFFPEKETYAMQHVVPFLRNENSVVFLLKEKGPTLLVRPLFFCPTSMPLF